MTALAVRPDQRAALLERLAPQIRARRHAVRIGFVVAAAMTALALFALVHMDISLERFGAGFGQAAHFISLMWPPEVSSLAEARLFAKGLAESIAIALLGTLLAALIAAPFAVLAARNVVPFALLRAPVRRLFDILRGVDILVWALVWINVVGLGPFAGILAIMTADAGILGRLFAEAIETANRKEIEGVVASGGGPAQRVRYGILPQVLPVMAGQVLYLIESNTRSATVIGIVGAGGIGLQLSEMMRTLEWGKVATLVLGLFAAVALIDRLSSMLRRRLSGT